MTSLFDVRCAARLRNARLSDDRPIRFVFWMAPTDGSKGDPPEKRGEAFSLWSSRKQLFCKRHVGIQIRAERTPARRDGNGALGGTESSARGLSWTMNAEGGKPT